MAKKISFDYDSILNRVLKNLSSQSSWANFLDFGVIKNVIASICNELSYEVQYSEYNSLENFWNLARNRSSLLQMSPMHGYAIPRKIASVGTIRVSTSKNFNSSYSKNIPIPKFFQFSGNGIYVCTKSTNPLKAGDDYLDIPCIQGEYKKFSFFAEGLNFEEKTIFDDSIDNSFFELTVNGVDWTETKSLFLCANDEQSFQIKTLPNLKGITLKFGNDIYGKKLAKNDYIEFKYISTKGSLGNIYSKDIIKSVESQAFDSEGKPVKLYCTNVTPFIGGKDYPTLDEIREVSPNVYQTGDRASSRTDFETIIRTKFTDFTKVSVWGAYETLKDQHLDPWNFIPSEENVNHLAILKKYDESQIVELTDEDKNEVIDYIHNICDPTELFTFEKVYLIPMVFYIKGTITSSTYSVSEVSNSIKNALSDRYNLSVMNFGENVYDSDFVRLIDEVKGIDNHISYIELYYEDKILLSGDPSTAVYFGKFNLPIYPIDYRYFVIYMKDLSKENSKYEEIATCDENGSIVGSGIYITTDSKIDLSEGSGILYIRNQLESDYTNYMFKIIYRFSEKNIINPNRANILYYDDAIIELEYN
jgi:hypothetical protein